MGLFDRIIGRRGTVVNPSAGLDVVGLDRVLQTYQYQPGWGGRLQAPSNPGYHPLAHAGVISGIVLADYEYQGQVTMTQAGGQQRLLNVYRVEYRGT